MNKKTILIVLLISAFWIQTNAQQNVSVSGYVSDTTSGETLLSANVALLELNRGSATNALGYFSIPNIKPGTYTIACSYIGYDLFTQEITLKAGENLRLDIQLVPNVLEGEEIIVESEADLQELKSIGTAQVKTELIKALPALRLMYLDPFNIYQELSLQVIFQVVCTYEGEAQIKPLLC